MLSLERIFSLLTGFLMINDTILAVDIRIDSVAFLKVKKQVSGFRILHKSVETGLFIPETPENFMSVSEKIQEYGKNCSIISVNIHPERIIHRCLTVPLVRRDEIISYLHRHSDVLRSLPVNGSDVLFLPEIIVQNKKSYDIQLTLIRREEALKWRRCLQNIHGLYQISFHLNPLYHLESFLRLNFTGSITDNRTGWRIEFEQGKSPQLRKPPIRMETEDKILNSVGHKESLYSIHTRAEMFPEFFRNLVSWKLGCTNDQRNTISTDYMNALMLCINPFHIHNRIWRLNSVNNQTNGERIIYRHLSRQLLFSGVMIMIFLLLISRLFSFILTHFQSDQVERLQAGKTLQAERENLISGRQRLLSEITAGEFEQGKDMKAYYLCRMGNVLPDDCFLAAMSVEPADGEDMMVQLTGFACSEKEIIEYMRALESLPFVIRTELIQQMVVEKIGPSVSLRVRESEKLKFRIRCYV